MLQLELINLLMPRMLAEVAVPSCGKSQGVAEDCIVPGKSRRYPLRYRAYRSVLFRATKILCTLLVSSPDRRISFSIYVDFVSCDG